MSSKLNFKHSLVYFINFLLFQVCLPTDTTLLPVSRLINCDGSGNRTGYTLFFPKRNCVILVVVVNVFSLFFYLLKFFTLLISEELFHKNMMSVLLPHKCVWFFASDDFLVNL